MKKIILYFIIPGLIFCSCEWFENLDTGLSDTDIVNGLKTALEVGTDSSSTALSAFNGYYLGDPLHVKIPLPDEVEGIRNVINGNTTLASISSLLGLESAFEDVIASVNHAAEDAAKSAAPIFKDAIFDLSIAQGLDILNGIVPDGTDTKSTEFDSTAATKYLQIETTPRLVDEFSPKINTSLGKDIVGGISATDAWDSMTGIYNTFLGRSDVIAAIATANLLGANINLPASITTDLGEFSTGMALNGLFYLVGQEEIKIRRNPFQWALDILHKVFG